MPVVKKTVTRYGRRRYARYGYRRYRTLSNQYFRTRIEGVYTIAFPQASGDPVFAENENKVLSFMDIYYGSQYYGSLASMFGYMKVTGASMEVTPGPTNYKGTATVGAKVLVGFRFGNNAYQNYHQLVANNNSILLGVDTTKRKYSPAMGGNGWFGANETGVALGSFSVASSITGTLSTMPTWTCRLCIYMLFKKSNV